MTLSRLLVVLALVGAGSPGPAAAKDPTPPLGVAVGIPPVGYLVERLGGDRVEVQVLSPSGQCAHQLSLSPKQSMALSKARLFIKVGMPFEIELQDRLRAAHPNMQFIDAAAGIKRRTLEAQGDLDHEHAGHDHDAHHHASGYDDPHVWLSPSNLKTMVANIATALADVDPAHAEAYRAREKTLNKEIAAIGGQVDDTLEPLRGATVYVYHPSLGYLLDPFAIRQKAVEEGGKAPSSRQLRALIHQARADRVRVIFVEQQSDTRSAQAVAEAVGARLVAFDPLAADVLANLDSLATKIKASQ